MPLKLIDTHAHLQAGVFESDLDALVACARAQGLQSALICASSPDDWDAARDAAHRYGFGYLLGIHPFEARRTRPADLRALEARIDAALAEVGRGMPDAVRVRRVAQRHEEDGRLVEPL